MKNVILKYLVIALLVALGILIGGMYLLWIK